MRSVLNRERPQKMGSSRMDHGRTSDVHDHANAALSNPILLWGGRKRERLADALRTSESPQKVGGKLTTSVRVQTQNRKVRAETLAELATGTADPVDQLLSDLTLAAQGEDCGITRVVLITPARELNSVRKLGAPGVCQATEEALCSVWQPASFPTAPAGAKNVSAGTNTPRPPTPSVPLTKLQGRRGLTGTRLLLALATTKASTLRGSTSTSTTAAATSTSAVAASTAAVAASTTPTEAPTPATTPTSTATPSASSTASTAAPTVPSTTLAPLALSIAAPPTRSRRSPDLLNAIEVDSSSRNNRGEKGDRGTPLKERGARVAARSTYSNDTLLSCSEALL
ncbi:unnamed protein product [Closterium sp. NIES-54]